MNTLLDFPQIIDLPFVPCTADGGQTSDTFDSERMTLAKIDVKAIALARFGDWRPAAVALVTKFKNVVYDPTTPKGYRALADAIAEVRAPRFAAQNVDKAFASEVTQLRKAVADERAQIIDFLAATEKHLVDQKDAHDARVKREAQERAAAELARTQAHRTNIATIYSLTTKAAGLSIDRLRAAVAYVADLQVAVTEFEEFAEEAATAKSEVKAKLEQMLTTALQMEEQAAGNERLRRENDERQQIIAAQSALVQVPIQAFGKPAEFVAECIATLKASPHAAHDAPTEVAQAYQTALAQLLCIHGAAVLQEQVQAKPTDPHRDHEALTVISACEVSSYDSALIALKQSPAVHTPIEAHPAADATAPRTLTTGQIGEALGFPLVAQFISSLGFMPTIVPKRNGSHWPASDFRAICLAVAAHATRVAETER